MANQNTVIGFGQIVHFSMETTSIWLKKYLRENEYSTFAMKNFVALVCAVTIMYDNFCSDKVLDTSLYHDDLFKAYRQEDWSLTMMRYLGRLRLHMTGPERAMITRKYYQKKRLEMMSAGDPSLSERLKILDDAARQTLGDEVVEKVIADLESGPD